MPGQPFPFIERVNAVSTAEPWRWLAAGWEDLRAARMKSVACSIPFVLAGYAVTFGLYQAGLHYLIWPALSGFFLLAPAFAVGYYEASRAREAGEMVRLGAMLGAWRRNASRVFGAGLTLCFFMILWLRSAALIYAINFPHGMISIQSILNQTFFSADGLAFLAIGTVVGAVFAVAAFLFSAVSLPMVLGERADLLPAIFISAAAVMLNRRAMILWAAIIVVTTAAGMATAFVGLIVTMPLLGHASWHAYRALVRPAGEG